MLGLQDCVLEDRSPHLLLLISISILGSRREDGHCVQPAQARQVILSSLVLNKIKLEMKGEIYYRTILAELLLT